MQNQDKRSVYVLRLITVLAFFCILCFPMAMLLLDGPDQTPVENEAVTELMRLNYAPERTGKGSAAIITSVVMQRTILCTLF